MNPSPAPHLPLDNICKFRPMDTITYHISIPPKVWRAKPLCIYVPLDYGNEIDDDWFVFPHYSHSPHNQEHIQDIADFIWCFCINYQLLNAIKPLCCDDALDNSSNSHGTLHLISFDCKTGNHPASSKFNLINDWPHPATSISLASFTGLIFLQPLPSPCRH